MASHNSGCAFFQRYKVARSILRAPAISSSVMPTSAKSKALSQTTVWVLGSFWKLLHLTSTTRAERLPPLCRPSPSCDGLASKPLLPFALLRCLGTVTERLRSWRALRARLTHPFLGARFDATSLRCDVGAETGAFGHYDFAFFFEGWLMERAVRVFFARLIADDFKCFLTRRA